jgi:hypothetical protein
MQMTREHERTCVSCVGKFRCSHNRFTQRDYQNNGKMGYFRQTCPTRSAELWLVRKSTLYVYSDTRYIVVGTVVLLCTRSISGSLRPTVAPL